MEFPSIEEEKGSSIKANNIEILTTHTPTTYNTVSIDLIGKLNCAKLYIFTISTSDDIHHFVIVASKGGVQWLNLGKLNMLYLK